MKKFIIILLAIILCVTGCEKSRTGYEELNKELNGLILPLDEKNTKISILAESSCADLNNKYIVKKLREITGLNLNIIPVNLSALESKLQTMIASKQLPDIFQSYLSDYEIYELAKNETIAPIDKYLDIIPNYKKLYVDTPENRRMFLEYQQYDGHIYKFKSYGYTRNINHCFMYRKDIFEKNGITPWTNTEEFTDNLRKLKEIYPDSYPFSSKQQKSLISYLAPQWGLQSLNHYYNTETSRWQCSKTSDKAYQLMLFLRNLYKEDLIDKNFLINTPSSWHIQMTTEESSFVTFDWVDRMDIFNENMSLINPEYEMTIGYPIGTEGKYLSMNRINSGSAMLVTNNKNVELSLKFLDFLISEKGAEITTLGIEGETFIKTDDGSIKYLNVDNNYKLNIKDLEKKYGLFFVGLTQRYDPRCAYFNYSPKTAEAQSFVKENNFMSTNYSRTHINVNQLETFNQIQDVLNSEFDNFIPEFLVSDEAPEVLWDKWIEKAKILNLEVYEQILNDGNPLPMPVL